MSSHAHWTLAFSKFPKAIRPMRRLLLSGLPLVLTTRYLAMLLLSGRDETLKARSRQRCWLDSGTRAAPSSQAPARVPLVPKRPLVPKLQLGDARCLPE